MCLNNTHWFGVFNKYEYSSWMYFDTVIILLSDGGSKLPDFINMLREDICNSSLSCIIRLCIRNENKVHKNILLPDVMITYFKDELDSVIINHTLPLISYDKYIIIMTDEAGGITSAVLNDCHHILCWNTKILIGSNVLSAIKPGGNKLVNFFYKKYQDIFTSRHFIFTLKCNLPRLISDDYAMFFSSHFIEKRLKFAVLLFR